MRTLSLILLLLAIAAPIAPLHALTLAPREPLTEHAVENLVRHTLSAEALPGEAGPRFRVEIDEPRLPLANHSRASTEIRLMGLERNRRSGRFDATLSGTTDAGGRFALAVRGRAIELIDVPVLARRIEPRERIGDHDLDWLEVAVHRLPRAAILDRDQVVGSEAKRRLIAGRVLTSRDIGRPLLVRRNQPVRLVYTLRGLIISTLGTAQDDGALGAPVRVVNRDSRRQVQGVVTGPDEVTVATSEPLSQ